MSSQSTSVPSASFFLPNGMITKARPLVATTGAGFVHPMSSSPATSCEVGCPYLNYHQLLSAAHLLQWNDLRQSGRPRPSIQTLCIVPHLVCHGRNPVL